MTNDCESAITKTGWGICHYFIIGLCGMCTLAEASASLIVLIVAPLLACDLNLNPSQATALNATSSFGMAVGAFAFGTVADAYGRKGSIPITMVIAFCASITLSFAQASFLINLSIFMLGLGLAGNNAILRVYLIECLPAKRRGACLAMLDLLWTVGYLSALGISWSLVPSALRMQGKNFRPNSWRVLAGLGGTPNLVMACVVSLLPPSPRYLLFRQRQEEAYSVLQQMYAINSSRHADTYPQSNLENCVNPDDDGDDESDSFFRKTGRFFRKVFKRTRQLFEAPFKRTTILGILISLLHFPGFVWLALWNTHVLDEMEIERSTCAINLENVTLGFLHNCEEPNMSRFEFLLLLSLSYILGEILVLVGIDIVGRKICLAIAGIVGASASLGLIFTIHRAARIVLSSIFLSAYAIGCTTTTTLILENYPTGLRGTIIGLTRTLPYILASLAKLSVTLPCLPSIIVASGLLMSAAIAGLALPDLTRAPMQE